jgi:hypothetical protein
MVSLTIIAAQNLFLSALCGHFRMKSPEHLSIFKESGLKFSQFDFSSRFGLKLVDNMADLQFRTKKGLEFHSWPCPNRKTWKIGANISSEMPNILPVFHFLKIFVFFLDFFVRGWPD